MPQLLMCENEKQIKKTKIGYDKLIRDNKWGMRARVKEEGLT